MKYWLVSPPSRRAVVLGVLVLGLALLAARAGIGLAAKDDAAPKPQRDHKPPVAAIDKAKLRYEDKSFEQWRDLMFTELSPETHVKALKVMVAFGRKSYGPEATKAILTVMDDYDLHDIVEILANLGPAAKDAVPVLMQWLKTPPPGSRYEGLERPGGYTQEGWFQCLVYDALEAITGKKPSVPRPRPSETVHSPSPF